MMYNTGVLISP